MLTFLGLLILVMLSAGCGAWAMKAYLEATTSQRRVALLQELAALRAAQCLTLVSWQSGQTLHDIASEPAPDKPPVRPGQ